MKIDQNPKDKEGKKLIFTRFITKNGKRIYHPKGGFFVFWVDAA